MKNIEYLLAKSELPCYTNEEKIEILRDEYIINGMEVQLSMCMEEFAELIEVITDNIIRGKADYLHLNEEICDCYMSIERLKIIFNINDDAIANVSESNKYKNRNLLNNCIFNLSTSIINLSKCIRKKDKSELKIIGTINTINETLYNLRLYYKLNYLEILQISFLKYKRSEERNSKVLPKLKQEKLVDNSVPVINDNE